MKDYEYLVVMVIPGTNTFVKVTVENHDDNFAKVVESAAILAKNMSLDLMYVKTADD